MSTEACNRTEDEVLAFVAGEMADGAARDMAEHLADCGECRGRAAELTARRADPRAAGEDAVRWHSFPTPFGTMYVAATAKGLARLSWLQDGPAAFERALARRFPGRPIVRDAERLAGAERQLREYFAGERVAFDLPLDLDALPAFERGVLEAARGIPFGDVIPYAELARRIGKPGASRAVGNALGRNPLAIIIPCHRIVRSDGSLGGYTGGVEYKRRLLELEGRLDLLAG